MAMEQDKIFGECRKAHGNDHQHHTFACYACVEAHVEKAYRIILACSKLTCERALSDNPNNDFFFQGCDCGTCQARKFVDAE